MTAKRQKLVFDMPLEYIFKQCGKVGEYALTKTQFEKVFPGKPAAEMKRIDVFCNQVGLEFTVDKKTKTFHFNLIERI